MMPEPGGRAVEEWTATVAVVYSLILAAGAGYVFYASIRPVTIATGYFAEFADYPWVLAFLVLLAVWGGGSGHTARRSTCWMSATQPRAGRRSSRPKRRNPRC